uniref:Uncharacterized protein n=1 Tax=Anguilla anguilla TaxID=7936 RepID=A0A0E9URL3_ANGAN
MKTNLRNFFRQIYKVSENYKDKWWT